MELVDLLDVLGEGDVELAGVGVEGAAGHRGDQDRDRALVERALDVVVAQVFLVVLGRGVALRAGLGGVVVAELDEQVVAGLDLVQDRVEAALFDEGAGGPAADGVVGDGHLLVEVAFEHLAPAGLGLPVGVIGLDGGVGGEVDGDPVVLCLGRGGGPYESGGGRDRRE
ncbi:hypothetical protein GCM10029992_03120 [Glycomyces albus]